MSNWNLVIPMEGKNYLIGTGAIGASGITDSGVTAYAYGSEPIPVKYRDGQYGSFYRNNLGAGHDAIANGLGATSSEYPITCRDFKYLGVGTETAAYGTQQGIFCYSVWIYLPSSNNPANYEDASDIYWTVQGVDLAGNGADSGQPCLITQKRIDFSLQDQWQQIYVIGYCDIPTVPFPDAEISFGLEATTYSGGAWQYYLCGQQLELLNEPYELYGYLRPTTLIHSTILGCKAEGRVEFDNNSYQQFLGYTRNDKWGGLIFNFEDDLYLPVDAYQGTGLSKREIETYTSLKAGKNANIDENSWSERTLIFKSTLVGNGTTDLTTKRRRLQSLFSNLGTQILYTGDGVDKIAKVEYLSGLEGNPPNGFVEENITINFAMYDPFFYGLQKENLDYYGIPGTPQYSGFKTYIQQRANYNMIAKFTKYGEFVFDSGVKSSITLDDSARVNSIATENGITYFVGDVDGGGTPTNIGLGYIANGTFTFNTDLFTGDTKLVAVDNGFVAVVGKINPLDASYSVGFWYNDGLANAWGSSDIGDPFHPMGVSTDLPTKMTVYRQGNIFWICLYLPNETTRFRNVCVIKATFDFDLLTWTSEVFPLSDTASNGGTLTNGWSTTRRIHDAILIPQKDKYLEKPLVAIGGQFTFTTYTPNLTWENNVILEPDELDSLISANHSYQYMYDGWYYNQNSGAEFWRVAQMVYSKPTSSIYYAEFENNTAFSGTDWRSRIANKSFGASGVIVKKNLVYYSANSSTKPISNMKVDHKGRPILYGNFVLEYTDWFVNQQQYQTKFRRALYDGNITFTNINMVLVDGSLILHHLPNVDPNRICYDYNLGDLIYAPIGTSDVISAGIETQLFDADAYKLEFDARRCELHYVHDMLNDKYFIINENLDEADEWQYRQENGQVEIKSSIYDIIFINCEDIILYPKQKNSIRYNIVYYGGVAPFDPGDKAFGNLVPMFIKVYAGVGY